MPALVTGGAQMMLAKLLEADAGRHHQIVVSLRPGGALLPRIEATGVEIRDLGLAPGQISPTALWLLVRLLRRWQPDLVHGWMYHGNAAALTAARLVSLQIPVLWNIRHSLHDVRLEKAATRAIIRAGAVFSKFAAGIVYNSALAAQQHHACGYCPERVDILPNGFDADLFRPDPGAQRRLRAELGIGPGPHLVGHIARYHPMKDHQGLLLAAQRLRDNGCDFILVLAGENITSSNTELARAIAESNLEQHVVMLGERKDVHQLMAGLDVLTLCSAWGEGFPNVLGEAMAVGLPCVSTDVGESGSLLRGIGTIIPCSDPDALAEAIGSILRLPAGERRKIGLAGRERIVRDFSLPVIADRYAGLYERLGRVFSSGI